MGLYAYFDAASCGLPDEITASDIGYPALDDAADPVEVDYSGALGHMVSTFMEIATSLVPVDTGYLYSTIYAETDGVNTAEFFADAEYAQYVEYGTWKMGAQPYFQPALDEALEVFITEAMQALTEAQQVMQMICQDIMAAAMAAAADMAGEPFGGFNPMGLGQMSPGAFFGGLAMGFLTMIVLFPILVNLYAILDTILGPFDPMQGRIDSLRATGIEVIIT